MRKTNCLIILALLVSSAASAQTRVYTNRDQYGNTYPGPSLVGTTDTKAPMPVPRSIVESARDTQLVLEARHYQGPTITIARATPTFAGAINAPWPVKTPEPIYYGNFVPLTPNGPLVNPTLFQTNRTREVRKSSLALPGVTP